MYTTRLRFILFFIVAASLALIHFSYLVSKPVLAQGTPIQVSSGDDFATQELGNPWDMSEQNDINYEITRDQGGMASLSIENGMLSATSDSKGDPRIWIRVPSNPIMNAVPQEGSYKPINANTYRYLTARIFVDQPNSMMVFWQANLNDPFGQSPFVRLNNSGWNLVSVDLGQVAEWTGLIGGLYLDPISSQGSFKVDFIRLSSQPPSTILVTWDGAGLDGNATISYDTDPTGATREVIATNVAVSSSQYAWNAALSSGTYYIFIETLNELLNVDPVTVRVNTPPQLRITAPSFISGPDYATTVVGNPWDMSDEADISKMKHITGSFNDGVFRGVNPSGDPLTSGDPLIELHVTTPIDTNRFKYATYRMLIEGKVEPLYYAPVVRYLWWTTGPTEATTTTDWVAYEGWQTISFDLTKMKLEPESAATWSNSQPTVFRFDPHEFVDPRYFQIDYMLLTGNDQANQQFAVRYVPTDADGDQVAVQWFYDTDAQGWDGQPLTCSTQVSHSPMADEFSVYLPIVITGSTGAVEPDGFSCTWTTANVPNGTYYIYGVIGDGIDTTRTYSETPVQITH